MRFFKSIFLCAFLFLSILTFAQKIKLERADFLKGGTFEGKRINRYIGNVIFSVGDVLIYCDSAYQFRGVNSIIAFGNARVMSGDSTIFKGNELIYNADIKEVSWIRENVSLSDKKNIYRRHRLKYKF